MAWPILIALAFVGLVVTLILTQRRAEHARTDALQQASLALGLAFEAKGDLDQIRALGDLSLYNEGRSRHVTTVMSGRTGDDEAKIFDYRYTTGGGKESHTWTQTVALYPGGGRGLPAFVLSPENVFHKFAALLGYQDIDFDSSPVFSSRYLLHGPDETAIRAAFTVEVRALLEQQLGWTVEVQAGSVGIYRAGKRAKAEEIATFIEESRAVLRALTNR
jgi:hypothetical protein